MAHAVADGTARGYSRDVKGFLADCKVRGLRLNSVEEIDHALMWYMQIEGRQGPIGLPSPSGRR